MKTKEERAKYYLENKTRIQAQRKEYNLVNKEKRKEARRKYYLKNKESIKVKDKQYISDNLEKVKIRRQKLYIRKKEEIKIKDRVIYKNNKEKIKFKNKQWNIDNPTYMKEYNRRYFRERKATDPLFKLKCDIRCLIGSCFRKQFLRKSRKTNEILGCTFEEFKVHLEKQFDKNMNWDNHGSYWEIDHIKPISLAKNKEEVIELNHFTNLRPLEKSENRAKSNKYLKGFEDGYGENY